ncbi:MAG: prolyl oligopeptidase family serine peptidase [Akkermansiaceae bacterium]
MQTHCDSTAFRRIFALLLSLSLEIASLPAQEKEKKNQQAAKEKAEAAKAEGKAKRGKKSRKNKKKSAPAPKDAITPADYGQWERLGGQQFSHDGRWLLYTVGRVDQEKILFLHDLKSKKNEPAHSWKQGERPVFSKDSKWLAITIGRTPAEAKKAKEPQLGARKLHLRNLTEQKITELEGVGAFSFSKDSRFAAMEVMPKSAGPAKPSSPPSKAPGKVLIVRDLAEGTDTTFGNVVKHRWSEEGSLLAFVVDSPSISNSLQLFDPARGVLRTLETSNEEYVSMTWREDAMDLAVMREMKHGPKEDVSHVLLAWRGLDKNKPTFSTYTHSEDKKFPQDLYIAGGSLIWSEDGQAIYCDLKAWEKKPAALQKKSEEPKKEEPVNPKQGKPTKKPKSKEEAPKKPAPKPEEPAKKKTLRETVEKDSNVEVWHSKDAIIMPLQKKIAGMKKNPKRRAVWWPAKGKLVQLANELTEGVEILKSGKHAVGRDTTPHERTAMFGPRLVDLYLIETTSGKRKPIIKGLKYQLASSPDGRFLLFLRDGHIWSHEIKTGEQRNLTTELKTPFTDQQDDTLAVEKRPYGRGIWLQDSSAVLLYDRFDIWRISPTGAFATRLTKGADEMIRHRLSAANFDEDEEGAINPNKPLYVALYGDRTKKSGYAKLSLKENVKKSPTVETLVWKDASISGLTTAEDSAIFAMVEERTEDSPDLFVGKNFRKMKQLTKTNPFQKNFLWGRSELINYQNRNGVPLQGMLTYPANYEPGKTYPMIVYIYEERSQGLHRYITPSEKHPYNQSVFSAEGYFFFQPDIIYRPQEPGISAVECVVPAVKKVLESGMVDKERVGLMGHSWGAYQTSFIITQTDLFAAGVAGAPLTNMMSMSVSVYWNSGGTNARIFAQSQGRMDTPFWRDVDNYVRNSPIHFLDKLKTPLLMTFGDKDGAVDWSQGVQMYNAARWAGKEDLVMLVYPGENHSLRQEENMVDYHYRVKEWFNHYLKKEEPKKWITEGKSWLDRQKEIEERRERKTAPKK